MVFLCKNFINKLEDVSNFFKQKIHKTESGTSVE